MNPPAPERSDDSSLQTRFQRVLSGLVLYLQARRCLFGLEAKEAAEFLSARLILALVALTLLFFGYALLLAGAIIAVDHFTQIPWWSVCLLLAPGHLLAGFILFRLAVRRPKTPLFEESINELAKDREWLSNPKKPWW